MIDPIRPRVDTDSQPFWDSLREKRLILQICTQCGKFRFPPYPSCPFCGAHGGEWQRVSGKGRVFSWVVVHRSPYREYQKDTPYTVALVELDEGPRIVSRLIRIAPQAVSADMRVVAEYIEVDEELTLLGFRPEKTD
jgi:uncharacterized OB-fold protein